MIKANLNGNKKHRLEVKELSPCASLKLTQPEGSPVEITAEFSRAESDQIGRKRKNQDSEGERLHYGLHTC